MRLEAEAGESKSVIVASSMGGGFVYKGFRGGDNNAIHAVIDKTLYIYIYNRYCVKRNNVNSQTIVCKGQDNKGKIMNNERMAKKKKYQ